MSPILTVATLFEPEPSHWGLRGDPHLWREMRAHFEETPLPNSADEMAALIETTFELLTGHSISEKETFFVKHFSHGGMSSGMLSVEFWRDQAIPLLCTRFFERNISNQYDQPSNS